MNPAGFAMPVRLRAGFAGLALGLAALAAAGIAVAVPAAAANAPLADAPASSAGLSGFRLTLDNDHFNFWQTPERRPDFGYTHGTEFALRFRPAPRGLVRLVPEAMLGPVEDGGETSLELRLRQSIFSPWRIYAPEDPGPDRSYAGWLEVAVGVSRRTRVAHHELLLHAGVTGPPSLAGSVQRSLHRAFRQGAPRDWSQEIPAEPGFGLEFAGTRRMGLAGTSGDWSIAAGKHLRARLATYAVDLRLGVPIVAGWRAPDPWPGGRPQPGFKWYVKLHPHLDLVARDGFLDGPLFRNAPGPTPGSRRLVAESEAGIGIGWSALRLEWTVLRRTPEFDGQPSPHTYSSLNLSLDR